MNRERLHVASSDNTYFRRRCYLDFELEGVGQEKAVALSSRCVIVQLVRNESEAGGECIMEFAGRRVGRFGVKRD